MTKTIKTIDMKAGMKLANGGTVLRVSHGERYTTYTAHFPKECFMNANADRVMTERRFRRDRPNIAIEIYQDMITCFNLQQKSNETVRKFAAEAQKLQDEYINVGCETAESLNRYEYETE